MASDRAPLRAGSLWPTMDRLSDRTRAASAFPPDAAAWLAGPSGRTVVLVGDPRSAAPLEEALAALGYDVRSSLDGTMSLPDRSVDAIVSFDLCPEPEVAARVLRPGGQVAVLVQAHDHRIPWVRKLRAALRLPDPVDPSGPMDSSPYFGPVSTDTFRHWQVVTRETLGEVVRALPAVLARSQSEAARAVEEAERLYDDYGRGPDGMQLPWVSHCYRAPVLGEAWAMVTERARAAAEAAALAERAARGAAARAAETGSSTDGPAPYDVDAVADETAGPHEPRETGESTEAMDADALRAAVHGTDERPAYPPPARPRPTFDMGDTAEGIITYVVDTGEIPPVRAPLAVDESAGGEQTQPLSTFRVLGEPGGAEPDAHDGPDDPDLLIRFR
ncbi:SAM-dependent methyltransferase [Nocardioides zeae]|uniref:SAM-dependent methyltransferase n=2 Tax=Nocardioides zeae TaxID=1457234 RepID=A0AAJ1X1G4_9ACTN|nr:SAM-dependent methyltransferase [Nocardioides zeae]